MAFKDELGKRIMFYDGGLGSLLQERGLKTGELPELWNLSKPEVLYQIHREYLEAGADIILANTFGANRFKFENVEEIVAAGVKNAKKAVMDCGRQAYVSLDIGSTGQLLKPMGSLDFEECVDVFAQIVKAGAEAGADLITIETQNDTYELKAAVLAAKENSNLPIVATVVFGENQKMLNGAKAETVVALLEGLGVDVIGMNCGLGPLQMKPIFEEMAKYASVPLVINPNAGLPKSVGGKIVYDVGPNEWVETMAEFLPMGAWIVGGCCGTTPLYIKKLVEKCRDFKPIPLTDKDFCIVTSYSNCVELGGKPAIIGERINPTGKSKFKQALRDGNMEYILNEGVKQADNGAHILDVNVGLPEINEVEMMGRTVYELQSILPLPLQIDTTNPDAMEKALRIYNGKPMVNSVNGKQEIMAQIFPIVKKYGGVVVGLALDEDGIPNSAEGRIKIAQKIYKTAEKYGISRKNIVIDALTMTMSTDTNSANITLDTVRWVKAHGGRTVLGVSNISFGLPQREKINSAFFTMAMQAGLSAGIINPNSAAMIQSYDTFCVLAGYDEQCMNYITNYALPEGATPSANGSGTAGASLSANGSGATNAAPAHQTSGSGANAAPAPSVSGSGATNSSVTPLGATNSSELTLTQCIVKGLKDKAYKITAESLKTKDTMEVINGELVPALDIVGKGFEKGTMFLPQLLMSAEAAKSGFEAIKDFVAKKGISQQKKATIVIATVKGDIHDIGKNIVKVLLENYGYDVIDLGKDVPPQVIADKVIETHAPLVGLSALMTTTVVNMEATIKLLHQVASWTKIMVGGAVLTQEYADMIGADFYGKDAMQSVYYAERLLNKEA